jgi:hypothetical protein
VFGSSTLDVAIGLAFLYLLLSLLCTAINELIESFLRKRAKDLEWGIHAMLARNDDLLAKFYKHPLISSLFDGTYQHRGHNLPAYIPSRNFALALLDLVLPAGTNKSGAARATAAPPPTAPPVVVNVPAAAPPAPASPDKTLVAALREAAGTAAVPEELRRTLLALIDAAGDDMNKVRENLEQWFNGTMDRVTGWYRRRIQWISGGVGVALAIALNADTFAIADSLSRDQTLRTSVTTAAEAYVKAHPPAPAEPKDTQLKDVTQQVNAVREFGWPLGWDRDDPRTIPRNDNVCRAIGAWALKVLGWILTAAAISLGAPFWFDTLNRIIMVRSSVKPAESPVDGAADKK